LESAALGDTTNLDLAWQQDAGLDMALQTAALLDVAWGTAQSKVATHTRERFHHYMLTGERAPWRAGANHKVDMYDSSFNHKESASTCMIQARCSQHRLHNLAHLQLLRREIEFIKRGDTKLDATFALVGSRMAIPHFESDQNFDYPFSAACSLI